MTKRPRPSIVNPKPYSVRVRRLMDRIPQTKEPDPALALMEALVECLQRGEPIPDPLAGKLTQALLLEMRALASSKRFNKAWPSLIPLLEGDEVKIIEPGSALAKVLGLRGSQGGPALPKRELVASVENRLVSDPTDEEYSPTLDDALTKVAELYECEVATVRNACTDAGLTIRNLRKRGLLPEDQGT